MTTIFKDCIECGEQFEVLEQFAYGVQLCRDCKIKEIENEEQHTELFLQEERDKMDNF